MREFLQSCLFTSALLLGLAVPFVIPASIGFWLDLPLWAVFLIAGVTGFVFLYAGFKWLTRQPRPLRTEMHPQLGLVTFYVSSWTTRSTFVGLPGETDIDGDAPEITQTHLKTFERLQSRFHELVEAAVKECVLVLNGMDTHNLAPDDFVLAGVSLHSEQVGDFTLFFEVPQHSDVAPWGMSVSFAGFSVEDAEYCH
jgi:hypothetical protein